MYVMVGIGNGDRYLDRIIGAIGAIGLDSLGLDKVQVNVYGECASCKNRSRTLKIA
jgi:hypothetical protein